MVMRCMWCNGPYVGVHAQNGVLLPHCEEHIRELDALWQELFGMRPSRFDNFSVRDYDQHVEFLRREGYR